MDKAYSEELYRSILVNASKEEIENAEKLVQTAINLSSSSAVSFTETFNALMTTIQKSQLQTAALNR